MTAHALPEQLVAICEAARTLVARGLVLGRGGNVSVRSGTTVFISPRGAPLDHLTPEAMVAVRSEDGRPLAGQQPSSELPMHLACYRARPEAQAVIHCHPPHVIALSTLGETVPALTPDFFVYMETIVLPQIPYYTPGTDTLATAVAEALAVAPVAVLANHGLIAVGETAERALARVLLAEETARIYLLARAVGQPRTLGRPEWDALRQAGYNIRQAPRTTQKGEPDDTVDEASPNGV